MRKLTEDEQRPAVVRTGLGTAEDFRRRIRDRLAARGASGADLDRRVEESMGRDIGFRFDLQDGEGR